MNNKGFALTETLVVVVFLVSIFTFIYVSIIPLIGKYENAIYTEKDIDIVYKLYHIRKLIMGDANRDIVTDSEVESINCSNLNKSTLCSALMEQLDLRNSDVDNYVIVYAESLNDSNIVTIKTINSEIGDYAEKYKNEIAEKVLFLLDSKKHTVSHLYFSLPPIPPICKRATLLHTEACVNSSTTTYCRSDGYDLNATITFGNLGTSGELPNIGDAFDCDVTGDGNYTERFYYLGDYYDTNTKTFDPDTAILIYYSDVNNGVAIEAGAAYHSADNWHGPAAARNELPTTTQWSNISLKNTARTILACSDEDCTTTSLSTSGGTITPKPFSYEGKAARMITIQELKHAGCDTLSGKTSLATTGALTSCSFILERTKYTDTTRTVYGPWLENPVAGDTLTWWISGHSRIISSGASYPVTDTRFGVRPVIEIPKDRILY